MLPQDAPEIPHNGTRFVSTKHINKSEFIYLLIFFDTEQFSAPPGIGIKAGTHGGGGSLGVTILGFGINVGASATVTEAYSQPACCVQMTLNKITAPAGPTKLWSAWELTSNPGGGEDGNGYDFKATDIVRPSYSKPLLGS
jgi:hypothetical protein